MYLDFFRLQREPFQVTPDPAYFYLFPSHREALAALIYGVEQRKGIIALTGEVGVGKTTVLRVFLERIDPTETRVIYLLNANVAFDGLLKMLLQEFDANEPGEPSRRVNQSGNSPSASPSAPLTTRPLLGPLPRGDGNASAGTFQRVSQLHRILVEHFRKDLNVVIIIDEAQNMPVETLEGLLTLSNLETATDKLLQIVFCGQPEFDEKLARPELRQLKQRIAVRATIRPLTIGEGMCYIQHRLSIAGVPEREVFTKGVIRQILKAAQGTPRLINILCDNALVTAYGYKARQANGRIAKEIIADHKAQANPRPVRWWLPTVGVAAAAVVVGGVLSGSIATGPMQAAARILSEPQRLFQVTPTAEDVAAPTQAVLAVVSDTLIDEEAQTAAAQQVAARVSEQEQEPVKGVESDTAASEEIQTAAAQPVEVKVSEQDQEPGKAADPDTAASDEARSITTQPVAAKVREHLPVERVVKPGDRLLGLVEKVYGARDDRLVQLVKQHNSQIKNSNLIRIGDHLVFPPNRRQE